jgi:hypothetical protein
MPPWLYITVTLLVGFATAVLAYRMLFRDFGHFMECLRVTSQSNWVTWHRRETGEAGEALKRFGWLQFWVLHNMVVALFLVWLASFITTVTASGAQNREIVPAEVSAPRSNAVAP